MPDLFLPKGVITPLVTPFRNDVVDGIQLRALIARQISAGIHGLIICDQMGEGLALTEEERAVVLSCALDSASEYVPVIAAVGTNCTSNTIDIVAAVPNGVTALLVTVPYYSKPTAKGIVHHFEQIAEATNLPIIIDDDPRRTAKPLTLDILEELRHVENIRGVRHCSGDVAGFVAMPPGLKRRFRHYAGDDRTALAYLMAGASSMSSPIANLFPELVCALLDLTRFHTVAGENAAHARLSGAIRALGVVEPSNLKHGLSLLVGCSKDVRLPLVGVDDDVALDIATFMTRHLSCQKYRPECGAAPSRQFL
jgi:4-hydroxy-tetrahydrodipicolinate synthase